MSIYKRGDVYWYKFMWNGKLVRESTKQGNDKTARKMEAAHRMRLAEGLVGIREKKPVPTLKTFCSERIEPYAKALSPTSGFGIELASGHSRSTPHSPTCLWMKFAASMRQASQHGDSPKKSYLAASTRTCGYCAVFSVLPVIGV